MASQASSRIPRIVYLFLIGNWFYAARPVTVHGSWQNGHATVNGGDEASGRGGECGYGNWYSQGYGPNTAALSPDLYNDGLSCGLCFQIKCNDDPGRCKSNMVTVTATDLYRPGSALHNNNGTYNPPSNQFLLPQHVFSEIAIRTVGNVSLQYRM